MNHSRCPWCGKKLDRCSDQKNIKKMMMPSALTYARCSHCRHYYGQWPRSKRMIICLVGLILPLIIGLILRIPYFMFLSLIFVFPPLFAPYDKMDENEMPVKTGNDLRLKIVLQEVYEAVPLNEIYFLTDSFDDSECFSAVSPIYLTSYHRRTGIISGHFLYEHPQNAEYIARSECKLYNSDMVLVAEIRLEHI